MDGEQAGEEPTLTVAAKAYIAFTAFGAIGVLGWLSQRDIVLRPLPAFVILTILAIVTEARPLVVGYKGQAFQFSVGSSLLLALMTMFGVLPAAIVQATASIISDLVNRKSWAKGLFNASQLVIAVGAAGAVLEAVLGREITPPGMSFGTEQLAALLLALGTFVVVNTALTALILRLAAGWSVPEVIRNFVLSPGSVIEASALLLVAPISITAQRNSLLALFVLAPIAAMYHATKVALANVSLLEKQRLVLEEKHAAEEMAREREAARVAAERANRAKSEFLSQMSHELRTPLNAVLGFAQLLEMDQLTPDQNQSTQEIIRGGKHLLGLINEVLDISRIEAGRLQLSLESLNVIEITDECISLVTPLADQSGIGLFFETQGIPGRSVPVTADRQRLRQVLLNLISNAIKYNCERGEVHVSLERAEGDRVKIHVTDTGGGIAPERMEQLFTPFERLGAEGSAIEGTGLGLALSKPLVEAMGGSISVASEPGSGSTFTVELRLAHASSVPPDNGIPPGAVTPRPTTTLA